MSPALLHLLHLVSPALPIGAYAYSQGLESAIEQGWLDRDGALEAWIGDVMCAGVATLDGPVLVRCLRAIERGDWSTLREWNTWILACRETKELLLEDQQLGVALQRLLLSLAVPHADRPEICGKPAFAPMFALACAHWRITEVDAI